MLRLRRSYYALKLVSDLLLVAAAFLFSSFQDKQRLGLPFEPDIRELFVLLVLLVVWYVTARATSLYDEFRSQHFSFEFFGILKNVLLQGVAVVVMLFSIKTLPLNRFFVAFYVLLLLVALGAWKLFLRFFLRWLRLKGRNLRLVLVLGAGDSGRNFCRTVQAHPQLGYKILGFLDDDPAAPDLPAPRLGALAELESTLAAGQVDEVVVALPARAEEPLRRAVAVCERFPVQMRLIPSYFNLGGGRFTISLFADIPIVSLRSIPLEEAHWQFLKRLFDLSLTLVLMASLFSWLWPLIALAIRLTSPGPVFFRQERWGRGNKRITCFKFRTMRADSRDLDENGRYRQAVRDDPRITRVGRWLRRSNLDELPQFLNVLRGDMSVVGPRPHPTPLNLESTQDIPHYLVRHLVKPGLTGWAQINGLRGETRDVESMRERVDHDIWYIENWSFWLDVQIVLMTAWRMLRGDPNAY